jgi:hypothetical protein
VLSSRKQREIKIRYVRHLSKRIEIVKKELQDAKANVKDCEQYCVALQKLIEKNEEASKQREANKRQEIEENEEVSEQREANMRQEMQLLSRQMQFLLQKIPPQQQESALS